MWMWMWSGHLRIRRDENEKICDPNKSCDLFFENDFNSVLARIIYSFFMCLMKKFQKVSKSFKKVSKSFKKVSKVSKSFKNELNNKNYDYI